jgi:hypothetical protein
MKKLITFSVILLSSIGAFITFTNESYKDNGRAGNTGSPGEPTCQTGGCHSGVANSGPGSVTITSSDMTGWEYVPGTTYNISVNVAETGKLVFGLATEALSTSNTNAGTLNVTNATRMRLLTAANGRTSLTHQFNGGLSNDAATFDFTWTAPSTDIGNITFYVAGNACNRNGNTSGDQCYTTTQVCTAKVADTTGTGIQSFESELNLNIFPNPVVDKINIHLNNTSIINNTNISLIDLSGKIVANLANNIQLTSNSVLSYDRPSNLNTGLYILQISNGRETKSSRLFLQ